MGWGAFRGEGFLPAGNCALPNAVAMLACRTQGARGVQPHVVTEPPCG
jgi:hypothetical protein